MTRTTSEPARDRSRSGDASIVGGRLWTRAFRTYWCATSVSNLGSGVSLVALPILAAQQLGAGAAQLGYLRALEAAPYVVLALVAGQLAGRLQPLLLMITADVVRALLFAGTAAAALESALGLPALYGVVFAVGTLTVVYDVAQFTVMPALVRGGRMVDANAAVEFARGAAFTLGPGLGGVLSAALRAMTAYLGVNNVCNQAFLTGLIAYLEVDRRGSSFQVGLAFGAYGGGFLLAAVAAPAVGRRLGVRGSVIVSSLISAAGIAVVGVSTLPRANGPAASAVIVVGALLVGCATPVFNVQSVALRLAVTPPELLGRVNAAVKLVSQGALPLGALAAGAAFGKFAPGPAFAVIAVVSFAATGILVFSPVAENP